MSLFYNIYLSYIIDKNKNVRKIEKSSKESIAKEILNTIR